MCDHNYCLVWLLASFTVERTATTTSREMEELCSVSRYQLVFMFSKLSVTTDVDDAAMLSQPVNVHGVEREDMRDIFTLILCLFALLVLSYEPVFPVTIQYRIPKLSLSPRLLWYSGLLIVV